MYDQYLVVQEGRKCWWASLRSGYSREPDGIICLLQGRGQQCYKRFLTLHHQQQVVSRCSWCQSMTWEVIGGHSWRFSMMLMVVNCRSLLMLLMGRSVTQMSRHQLLSADILLPCLLWTLPEHPLSVYIWQWHMARWHTPYGNMAHALPTLCPCSTAMHDQMACCPPSLYSHLVSVRG